ncbi:hypothetical protein FZEAL_7818 [Fusarium zealandicum]|uniref:F-box domain-containing protein n=1 Tax=Fusarium zealandicum TaxID=1053134 RepID=A0A8H4UFN6_9HYPO|nr:hypothetical protein FZEAL_7818 [Fusarium zealandicum]
MATPDAIMADTSNTVASPANATSHSPFNKLPLEILLRITHRLTTPELGNVRLTCRAIEQALYTTFINEFFTRKQFMLSQFSLEALIDISKSRLSQHLRKVQIGLDRHVNPRTVPGVTDHRKRGLLASHVEQATLISTGHHRVLLVEAFRNLSNLEEVEIRDFNSSRRTRDGPYKHWASYGSTTAYQVNGYRPDQGTRIAAALTPVFEFQNMAFSVVLFALGQAGARPKGLVYMSRNHQQLSDEAFNIASYMEPSVVPVLQGLEKLHVDITQNAELYEAQEPPISRDWACDRALRYFLVNSNKMKHLRINNNTANPDMGNLLIWLAQPSSSSPSALEPSPSFPDLEEINLGSMFVKAPVILALIRKFAPTLKRLELWKVTLLRDIPEDPHYSPKVNFWSKFLERLRNIPDLDLRHIKIGHMAQRWFERPIIWAKVVDGDYYGDDTAEYTGSDWKHFVGELIPKVTVQFRDIYQNDGDTSNDEDEDGDSEDDGVWDQYALDL